jgi:hypothetical protein
MSIPFKIDNVQVKWGEHEKSVIVCMSTFHKKRIENTIQLATVDWLKRQCYVNIMSIEKVNDKLDLLVAPNGLFFAIVFPQKIGSHLHFYAVEEKNKSMSDVLLFKLQNQTMKCVSFSPFSSHIVIYNENKIWFAEIKQIDARHEFKLIREVDQKSELNSAQWSQCGRFVGFASHVNNCYYFSLFDFIGRNVFSNSLRDVKGLYFRPSNFAKYSVVSTQLKNEIRARIESDIASLNIADQTVRSQKKHLAKMRENEGFDRLLKYLKDKEDIWHFFTSNSHSVSDGAEMVRVFRIDKEELIEEIEHKQ